MCGKCGNFYAYVNVLGCWCDWFNKRMFHYWISIYGKFVESSKLTSFVSPTKTSLIKTNSYFLYIRLTRYNWIRSIENLIAKWKVGLWTRPKHCWSLAASKKPTICGRTKYSSWKSFPLHGMNRQSTRKRVGVSEWCVCVCANCKCTLVVTIEAMFEMFLTFLSHLKVVHMVSGWVPCVHLKCY